jgi:hypothetical protein
MHFTFAVAFADNFVQETNKTSSLMHRTWMSTTKSVNGGQEVRSFLYGQCNNVECELECCSWTSHIFAVPIIHTENWGIHQDRVNYTRHSFCLTRSNKRENSTTNLSTTPSYLAVIRLVAPDVDCVRDTTRRRLANQHAQSCNDKGFSVLSWSRGYC